jgi:hypothetical protein
MRGFPKYIATKQDFMNLLSISDDYATLTAQPAEIGLKGAKIESIKQDFTTLFTTKATNSKEVNDLLDVCTASLTPDDFKSRALAELIIIRDMDDDKASRTISIDETTGEAVTEEIDNPMPLWKVKGFGSREEVAALIAQYGGK